MKNKLLFLLFLLASANISFAQEDSFIIISTSGEVILETDENDDKTKIVAGAKIPAVGKLILSDGASVKFICNERPHNFNGPTVIDLNEIYTGDANQSMSFTGRFWNFIVDGLKNSDSDADLEEYHREYLNITGGIKGYSEDNKELSFLLPFPGIITQDHFLVSWKSTSDYDKVNLSFQTMNDRTLVFQRSAINQYTKVNLEEIGLTRGNSYYLSLEDIDDNKTEIVIHFKELDLIFIDNRLNSLIGYHEASEKEKLWMKATVLEMENYMMDANNIYIDLLELYPEDNYIKKLYKLFLTRNNLLMKN